MRLIFYENSPEVIIRWSIKTAVIIFSHCNYLAILKHTYCLKLVHLLMNHFRMLTKIELERLILNLGTGKVQGIEMVIHVMQWVRAWQLQVYYGDRNISFLFT